MPTTSKVAMLIAGAHFVALASPSAAFAQTDAAAAGDSTIEKSRTKNPSAIGKNAIAAAAKRRARSI